jgi:phosphoglycolate phosphatase
VSLLSVNEELAARNLPQITEDFYRSHFDFPVKDFYQKLGINFSRDNFDEMSRRFLEIYFRNLQLATLHKGVKETLQYLRENGVRQYVLSAMEQKRLDNMLAGYGIDHFFDKIQGLGDIYADGKIADGKKLMATEKIDTTTAWMVGDTLHDLEVARALGLHCILFSSGHQNRERLLQKHDQVMNDYQELKKFLAERI